VTPHQFQRVKELLQEAWDRDGGQRAAFLDEACAGDPVLRLRVNALLAAEEKMGDFLAHPALDLAKASAATAASEPWAAGSDGGPLPPGTRVGRFAIDSLIGKGGMAVVYRGARADDFRMQVAIKLLKRGTDTETALSRFRAERQILAELQHPNIARLLDGGATEAGLPYFVMEYVDGTPLLEYAATLPVRRRLELFRAICQAVQYAHQNLVVHRDIKPANILVTREGIPKLLDFGIAKLLGPAASGSTMALTVTGVRLMTPSYASPEQVRGEPVTTSTDIYSLGTVLYELLTGRRAHALETYSPEEIHREICTREPPKPSTVARELDPDLDNIVLMSLRKEPQRRYASAEQLSEDIRLYLEGRPVRARKDTVRYRASKFLRRNKVGVALGGLALIGVVTGVLAVNRQARRAEYRFQEVRKLAHTVLFDLNGEIENLAGSTKARELLVRTSLQYLDSLAAEGGSDRSLQLEIASAYEKIGDVQGNPLFSHLGHPKASLESYGHALAIAQKLAPSQPVLELMARARYKTGCVFNWGLGRFSDAKESIQQGIRVADSIPRLTGQPAYRVRVEAYGFLGDMQTYRDAGAALPPLRHSLEVARQWAVAEPRSETTYFLAIAMSRMGVASQETGDLSAALDFYTNALGLIDQLLKQQPENATWQRERDAMYDRLGWVTGHPQYLNLGDRKAAAVWARKLVSPDAERLAEADPENVRARFEVGEASAALGAILRESDPLRSQQLYRRSLALSASILLVNPDDAETAYWRSFNQVGFAWVLQKLGNRTEALKELESAVERLQRLARQNPDDVRVPEYLGLALHTLAAHRLEMGDRTGAGQDLERSLGLLEPLYQANPRKLTRLRDLADCYRVFGNLHASRSEWPAAHAWYRKSLELWQRWGEVGTSSVYDRQRREAAALLVAKAAGNIKAPARIQ
jgi:tetratricopeptide (TPR) repeat protein